MMRYKPHKDLGPEAYIKGHLSKELVAMSRRLICDTSCHHSTLRLTLLEVTNRYEDLLKKVEKIKDIATGL